MALEPPSWWYGGKPIPLAAWGLWPVSKAYGAAVQARFLTTIPYRSKLPVVCVGNFTVGGAGKTPLALKLAALLCKDGWRPAFLSRGYGGRERGPRVVNPDLDTALDVGDEPLLLAKTATTVVSRRRPDGAQLLETLDHDIILMDDGFQNPGLHKDVSVIVIDGGVGLGSGKVFPLGPLRAPLSFQAAKADAIVIVDSGNGVRPSLPEFHVPVFKAEIVPAPIEGLGQKPIIAFCGIGRPGKFFATLEKAGLAISQRFSFPDHHLYTETDATMLLKAARDANVPLITTEKDCVRLKSSAGALRDLRDTALTLSITLEFPQEGGQTLIDLIRKKIRA